MTDETKREEWATTEQTDAGERLEVLHVVRHVLARLPVRLGDRSMARVWDAVEAAMGEARKHQAPMSATHRRPYDGVGFIRERLDDYASRQPPPCTRAAADV